MKKAITMILVCIMLVTISFDVLSEETMSIGTSYSFSPIITATMDRTTSEWFGSPVSRALLSILLLIEAEAATDTGIIKLVDLTEDSYVIKDNSSLSVYFHGFEGAEYDYMFFYDSLTNQANFMPSPSFSSSEVEILFEISPNDGYYKNDLNIIKRLINDITNELATK